MRKKYLERLELEVRDAHQAIADARRNEALARQKLERAERIFAAAKDEPKK